MKPQIEKTGCRKLKREILKKGRYLFSSLSTSTRKAFTLIELVAVITMIGILYVSAIPLFKDSILHTKEAALRKNLRDMRECIDRYYADTGEYPPTLEALVEKRYLREIPPDPFTESSSTWKTVPRSPELIEVFDVFSGSDLIGSNNIPYSKW